MSPANIVRILSKLDELDHPSPAPENLLSALRDLDALTKDPSIELPGDLRHYLERRSYAKARMFLNGLAPIPAGACGRGAN